MRACRTEAEWERRLRETSITIGKDVRPDELVSRYDADTREEIVELTTEAACVMVDWGETQIWLDELDAAADRLEVMA